MERKGNGNWNGKRNRAARERERFGNERITVHLKYAVQAWNLLFKETLEVKRKASMIPIEFKKLEYLRSI